VTTQMSAETATAAVDSRVDAAIADPDEVDAVEVTRIHSEQNDRGISWGRVLAYGVLPIVALLLTTGAGYAKWNYSSAQASNAARIESVRAATDTAVAMLSYKSETVEKDLAAARDRLTGDLKQSYTSLIHDVVIPGSRAKQISTSAKVAAAAPVSASGNHAVVLVFVNQTITMGNSAPTNTASSVRMTLDKTNGKWLVSQFDPV
jgi:Mce-associated membrane protein